MATGESMAVTYQQKFEALPKEAQSEVADFIDYITMKYTWHDENGFTWDEVKELKRRIADLDAGNGKPHGLIEVD